MFVELLATYLVLKKWKHNPAATKRQIGIWSHWLEEREENEHTLSAAEVEHAKAFLKQNAPTSYLEIFLRDKQI